LTWRSGHGRPPVRQAAGGNVFGIVRGGWGIGTDPHSGLQYTKVSVFFAELSGYALADPG
jgi:hypothetical protein